MKIVHLARKKEISVAEIGDVYPNDGCAILKTIVVTTLMKMMRPVPDVTVHAPNLNSDATMTSVSRVGGSATTMTIAETEVTKIRAPPIRAEMTNSNVLPVIVSRKV
jgi:hypothetical protein